MRRKLTLLSFLLMITFMLTSCKPFWVDARNTFPNQNTDEKATYTDPKYNLPRDYVFELKSNSSTISKISETLEDSFGVFLDSDLTQKVNPKIEADTSSNTIKILPPNHPILESVDDSNNRQEKYKSETTGEYTGEVNTNWGNASSLYLAQFVDTKNGDKLAKPLVTVFTIKPELKTPTLEFYIKEDGRVGFKWDKVEGAEKYIIYSFIESEDMQYTRLYTEGITTDTYFEDFFLPSTEFNDNVITMNNAFVSATTAKPIYCVMAVSGEKKSLMSNLLKMKDYANKIVYGFFMENDDYKTKAVGTMNLPTHLPIKMVDGTVVSYPLTYKLDTLKHNEIEYEGKKTYALMIKAQINNTLLTWDLFALDINKDTIDADMKAVVERQEKLKGNALKDELKVDVPSTPPDDLDSKPDKNNSNDISKMQTPTDKIFASTPMVNYLAINMLNGETNIGMSDFPEASDRELLLDSIFEAYYQNPLILSIKQIGYDYNNDILIIEYKQSREEQKQKQEEIINEVSKVTDQIIKAGMSDLEKEKAINDYLCQSAEYDFDALENAKANNMIPDERFNDSFTPYGILIKKVGVCASYASSFKLLADNAGLNCIVVTGTLNGSLPHAWNRVSVNGNWMTVDSTNNDNDFMPNSYFNLPDSVAKNTLVEDNEYILDKNYGSYKGDATDLEYYKISNKYFSKSEIAKELAKDLADDGIATLRTDYDLTESEFRQIAQDTMGYANIEQIDKAAFNIGVIYFQIEK